MATSTYLHRFFFFFLIWNCEFGAAIFGINRKIVKSLESENEK